MLFPLFLYEFSIGQFTVAVKQLVDIQPRFKVLCVHGDEVALLGDSAIKAFHSLHVEDLEPRGMAARITHRDVEDAVGWVGIGRK